MSSSGSTRRSRRAGWRGSRAAAGRARTGRRAAARPRSRARARSRRRRDARAGQSRTWSGVASRSRRDPERGGDASRTRRVRSRTRSRRACAARRSARRAPRATAGSGSASTGEGAAVDEQRVAGLSEQRGELVHEPAGHTGGRGLGRRTRPAATSTRSSGVAAEREGQATASAGARREPGPDRHGRARRRGRPVPPSSPRSWRARTTPATNRPHAGSTVEGSVVPSTATATSPASWADAARTACAIGRRPDPDRTGAVDRQRQDEPVVVVGVVAHEVDPSRSDKGGHRRHSDFNLPARSVDTGGMSRFQMSWEIAKRSWAVLRADKTLAWFPVLSALGFGRRGRGTRGAVPRGRHRRHVDRHVVAADRLRAHRRRVPRAGDGADVLPRRSRRRRRPAPPRSGQHAAERARHRQLPAPPAAAVGGRDRDGHHDPPGDRGALRAHRHDRRPARRPGVEPGHVPRGADPRARGPRRGRRARSARRTCSRRPGART